MKKISLLLGFIAVASVCHAQISWGRYSHSFIEDENKGPQLITAIPSGNDAFWGVQSPSVLQDNFENDSAFMSSRHADFSAVTSFDNQDAQFFVKDTRGGQFEYRVVQDGRQVIVDWSPLVTPAADSVRRSSTLRDLMYIGGFRASLGHYIVVDLRRRNKKDIISTAVVSWKTIRPSLFNIYTSKEMNGFLSRLSHPDGLYPNAGEINQWKDKYGPDDFDTATGLPKKLVTPANDNSLIFLLRADIRNKEQLQYELVKDNKIIRPWDTNEFDNNFIWLKDLAPGEYTLRIRFSVQPANTLEYNFKVQPPAGQAITYLIASSLTAAFLVLIIIYLRQKRRTKNEARKREKLELEMKGLRSQLNPHFVFNALNSIQGLVNTGRVQQANEYIVLFAKMMRETLTLGNVDQAPLQQEMDYLDAYLKLEQLRFNFDYSIHADASLRTGEINFPTLLLQPLVENAVKHGVSNTNHGNIVLNFDRKNSDLVVTLTDNGKGFHGSMKKEGYGLHLTKQRIGLINQAAGSEQVLMNIQSIETNGTKIQLIFKGWL